MKPSNRRVSKVLFRRRGHYALFTLPIKRCWGLLDLTNLYRRAPSEGLLQLMVHLPPTVELTIGDQQNGHENSK